MISTELVFIQTEILKKAIRYTNEVQFEATALHNTIYNSIYN